LRDVKNRKPNIRLHREKAACTEAKTKKSAGFFGFGGVWGFAQTPFARPAGKPAASDTCVFAEQKRTRRRTAGVPGMDAGASNFLGFCEAKPQAQERQG
jgi:hypothetical protein